MFSEESGPCQMDHHAQQAFACLLTLVEALAADRSHVEIPMGYFLLMIRGVP